MQFTHKELTESLQKLAELNAKRAESISGEVGLEFGQEDPELFVEMEEVIREMAEHRERVRGVNVRLY